MREITLFGSGSGLRGSSTNALWAVAAVASVAISAYHGSKRHGGSIGWGIGWGLAGGLFPILTPAIAFAQGVGTCRYNC